jgi:hypothetical protein
MDLHEQSNLHQAHWLLVCFSSETQYNHLSVGSNFHRRAQNFCKAYLKYSQLFEHKQYGLMFLQENREQYNKTLRCPESKDVHALQRYLQGYSATNAEVVDSTPIFPQTAITAVLPY